MKVVATLSALAQEYSNSELIATRVFPVVPSDTREIRVTTFSKDAFRIHRTKRAKYADSNLAMTSPHTETLYELDEDDLTFPLDLNYEGQKKTDEQRRLTILAQEGLELGFEKAVADIVQDTNSYPAGNSVTLSGTSQYSDYDNSTPVDDVEAGKELIRQKVGKKGNKIVMGSQVWKYLRKHPELSGVDPIRNRVIPATLESVTLDFGVSEILIGEAIYIDDDGTSVDIWGNNMVVFYCSEKDTTISQGKELSFGYTFSVKGYPKVDIRELNEGKVQGVRNTMFREAFLTANNAGYLIANCTA